MIKIGINKINITPENSLPLAGYPNIKNVQGAPNSHDKNDGYKPRESSAIGLRDPLYAKVLSIKQGEETFIFISVDLLVVTFEFTKKLKEKITELTGIHSEQIIVLATHTHSGPEIFNCFENSNYDIEQLISNISKCVLFSLEEMVNVNVKIGKGSIADYVINRNNPKGLIDPELNMIRFEDEEGRVIGLVVNATVHPIILSSRNLYYSNDIVGVICETLENVYDSCICFFMNGAAGNINPIGYPFFPKRDIIQQDKENFREGRPSIRTQQYLNKLGRLIASEAIKTAEICTEVEIEFLKYASTTIDFPMKSKDELIDYCGFLNVTDSYKSEILSTDHMTAEIQAFSFGPIIGVALPGEPFVEIGLTLKSIMRKELNIIIGFANSDPRYLPTDYAFHNNLYETFGTPVTKGVENILINESVKLIKKMEEGIYYEYSK